MIDIMVYQGFLSQKYPCRRIDERRDERKKESASCVLSLLFFDASTPGLCKGYEKVKVK